MSDKFKGYTPGKWVAIHPTSETDCAIIRRCLGTRPTGQIVAFVERASSADLELIAAAPELLAENERLRARVAELIAGYREAIESMQLQQEVDAHRAVLDGVIESVQAYHAYLAAQLDGAHP